MDRGLCSMGLQKAGHDRGLNNNSNIFICKDHFVKHTEVQEYFSMYTPVTSVTLSLRFGGFLPLSEP